MNILLLNTHNPLQEAGAVSLDLYKQLRKRGHNVRLLVNSYDSGYDDGILSLETKLTLQKKILKEKVDWRTNKIKKALKFTERYKVDPDYCFFQLSEEKLIYKTETLLKTAQIKLDVIIVLFAKGFINTRNIFELNHITNAPIFWLMYDMAPFTGGCHYAWDCKGYLSTCGRCPGLFSDDPKDITNKNLSYKKKYLDKTNIQIIAASEWQYKQVEGSALFKNRILHKVLLNIDPVIFKPVDKKAVRRTLGIPETKKVIFFGAVVLTQRRKGMSFLLESLNIFKEKSGSNNPSLKDDILLLIAGNKIDGIVDLLPFEYHYLGKTGNTHGIASAYQASDLFLCPSIEDSGPMMINQSLMCGTPVVSFEMGVAVDLVKSGFTGYAARLKDSDDMALGLYNILSLDADNYRKMSDNCREIALKMCSPEEQVTKIESILHKSLGNN